MWCGPVGFTPRSTSRWPGPSPRTMSNTQLSFDAYTTQRAHLARVLNGIGATVMDFARGRGAGAQFHADELRAFIAARHPTAPGSADRILRDLRQRGVLSYSVVNRRASLYRIERVAP